jgi:hypothetical protein
MSSRAVLATKLSARNTGKPSCHSSPVLAEDLLREVQKWTPFKHSDSPDYVPIKKLREGIAKLNVWAFAGV